MRNTELKFEIPNNMDINLPKKVFEFLQQYTIPHSVVDCFYTPLRIEDGSGVIRGSNLDDRDNITTEDYIHIVNEIHKYFPNKVQLLIQNNIVLSKEQLDFYINLGISKFCCGNYTQAKMIREVLPNAEICASITMNVHDYDLLLHPEYKDVFNDIILPFEYARKLDDVNNLSNDFNYRMIMNSLCSIFCEGVQHWTSPIDESGGQDEQFCPLNLFDDNKIYEYNHSEITSYVQPSDLNKFKTITCWKLQDRAIFTDEIIEELKKVFIKSDNDDQIIDYNSYYKYIDIYIIIIFYLIQKLLVNIH